MAHTANEWPKLMLDAAKPNVRILKIERSIFWAFFLFHECYQNLVIAIQLVSAFQTVTDSMNWGEINLYVEDFENSSHYLSCPCESLAFDSKYIQKNYSNIHFSVQKTEILNVCAKVNFKSLSQVAYYYFSGFPTYI